MNATTESTSNADRDPYVSADMRSTSEDVGESSSTESTSENTKQSADKPADEVTASNGDVSSTPSEGGSLSDANPTTTDTKQSSEPMGSEDETYENPFSLDSVTGDVIKPVRTLFGYVEAKDRTKASKSIKLKNFLTARDDVTIFNVSFLSRPREWHALAVGFFVAIGMAAALVAGIDTALPQVALSGESATFTAYFAGVAWTIKSAIDKLGGSDVIHYRDALREPAYTVGGYLLGALLRLAFEGALNYGLISV